MRWRARWRDGPAPSSSTGGLSSFLAHVQLFDAGVEPGAAVEVIVVGGGRAYVDEEVRTAALEARVVAVDERAPEELDAAIAAAAEAQRPVVLVAGARPSALARAGRAVDGVQLLSADLRHPEHLRALLVALAAPVAERGSGRLGRASTRSWRRACAARATACSPITTPSAS